MLPGCKFAYRSTYLEAPDASGNDGQHLGEVCLSKPVRDECFRQVGDGSFRGWNGMGINTALFG